MVSHIFLPRGLMQEHPWPQTIIINQKQVLFEFILSVVSLMCLNFLYNLQLLLLLQLHIIKSTTDLEFLTLLGLHVGNPFTWSTNTSKISYCLVLLLQDNHYEMCYENETLVMNLVCLHINKKRIDSVVEGESFNDKGNDLFQWNMNMSTS